MSLSSINPGRSHAPGATAVRHAGAAAEERRAAPRMCSGRSMTTCSAAAGRGNMLTNDSDTPGH